MEPGSVLAPEFNDVFHLGYFQGTKELVPTGWGQVDDEKTYPTLASRKPQLQQTIENESSPEYDMTTGQAGSESSNEEDPLNQDTTISSATRMTEESSDEDDMPPIPVINNRVS
jgi:ubiquitin carboxyl-terminal hydrolase 4/11/15